MSTGCSETRTEVPAPKSTIETLPTLGVASTLTPPSPTSEPVSISATPLQDSTVYENTVIAFTGVIVPARCVQEEISNVGGADYIYDEVRGILKSADITVGVYNATMRDNVPYMGCVKSWELIGSTNNADALARAGFDVMAVATNHIKDCGFFYCGDEGMFSTLSHLDRVGILSVGAGENLEDALAPVIVEVNGIKFGFISLGDVNENVFSDDKSPGIAYLSVKNLERAIQRAGQSADVIIALPHSGPEDYPEVTPQQKYWARHLVEYGADLVVMTHAHILQGYEMIEDVPVFYSLGNFVFDQVWARDHSQAAILLVEFNGEKISSIQFIPTIVDQDGTVHLAEEGESIEILERIELLSEELADGK